MNTKLAGNTRRATTSGTHRNSRKFFIRVRAHHGATIRITDRATANFRFCGVGHHHHTCRTTNTRRAARSQCGIENKQVGSIQRFDDKVTSGIDINGIAANINISIAFGVSAGRTIDHQHTGCTGNTGAAANTNSRGDGIDIFFRTGTDGNILLGGNIRIGINMCQRVFADGRNITGRADTGGTHTQCAASQHGIQVGVIVSLYQH